MYTVYICLPFKVSVPIMSNIIHSIKFIIFRTTFFYVTIHGYVLIEIQLQKFDSKAIQLLQPSTFFMHMHFTMCQKRNAFTKLLIYKIGFTATLCVVSCMRIVIMVSTGHHIGLGVEL